MVHLGRRSSARSKSGNHADLAVLDRDCFTVSDEDLKRIRSLATIVGGKVVHNEGIV